jgi:hypothetical protein
METVTRSAAELVSLESVLNTVELSRRPSRSPDYQAENQALVALMQELANSPSGILQKLVDTALEFVPRPLGRDQLAGRRGRAENFPLARRRGAVGSARLGHYATRL